MSYVLGIDVSTTAAKAVLVGRAGSVVAVGTSSYTFETPRPLWSEQDPELWWSGAVDAVGAVMQESGADAAAVTAIGLTGQMHGLVLLDEAGAVLRPSILWNDQRSAAECDEIRERIGRRRMIDITGNEALTGFTAAKLLWVRNHEPDVWAGAAHMLLPKDYVRLRLTDRYAMDKAGGSGTQLFDLSARTFSPEVLDALQLDESLFPDTFEGHEVTGELTLRAAEALGLRPGIQVVAGGGDQSANAVGAGAVREGVTALSLGTSGVIFAATEEPRIEPEGRVHSFCHAVEGRWHMMGVMLSAAGSLRWFRDALAPDRSFADLDQEAASAPVGADGLLFAPYLSGERTPHADPKARGAFVGLTVRHGLPHMARAVMEGVAFGLADGLELMVAAGLEAPSTIVASGGGTMSGLWMQILADTLGAELATASTSEGAAYGAALLAAVGAGWFSDTETACSEMVTTTVVAEPGPDRESYLEAHARFKTIYPALKTILQ